jgi:hypothetical protein
MHGIDCQITTFSLVTKLNTMRVLLSPAANLDWPLHEFDMKNMFLHGNIKKKVYMEISLGYIIPSSIEIVCKL